MDLVFYEGPNKEWQVLGRLLEGHVNQVRKTE